MIAPGKELGLHNDFPRAVESMPAGKAPGLDGVTEESLNWGSTLVVSYAPFIQTASVYSWIPPNWNVAALQLIWKAKGRHDGVEKYRPITLAIIFRNDGKSDLRPAPDPRW